MLDRLPESAGRRQWPVLPASLALAVHGALLLGVVELRADPRPRPPAEHRIEPYRVVLAGPPPVAARVTGGGSLSGAPAVAGAPALPGIRASDLPSLPAPVPSISGDREGRRTARGFDIPGPGIGAGAVAVTGDAESGIEPPELLAGSLGTSLDEARRFGFAGVVVIRCIVDTLGRVEPGSIEVLSEGEPTLAAAATRAMQRARFRPGSRNGLPVRVQVLQRVWFTAGAAGDE